MNVYEHIPDTLKAGVAVAAPGLTLLGVPVEEWTFILSGIVSIIFIIEKLPVTYTRLKEFIQLVKGKRNAKREKL